MSLLNTLEHLFPGIQLCPGGDCEIVEGRIAVWRRAEKQPTPEEIAAAEPAALLAQQAEDAKRQESDTARDDAKRALSALDTIITGIDAANLTQAKAAIKQLAQIQRHIILATVGR